MGIATVFFFNCFASKYQTTSMQNIHYVHYIFLKYTILQCTVIKHTHVKVVFSLHVYLYIYVYICPLFYGGILLSTSMYNIHYVHCTFTLYHCKCSNCFPYVLLNETHACTSSFLSTCIHINIHIHMPSPSEVG